LASSTETGDTGIAKQPGELAVYFSHVGALLWPGRATKSFVVHSWGSGTLLGWKPQQLTLLIEQGRLQLSRQRQDLENIRSRGQFLFTAAIGVLGLIGLVLPEIAGSVDLLAFLAWVVSGAATFIGILGAAAVVVARKSVGEVDTSILSQVSPPIEEDLARAYANSISEGENTVATEITVFRDAVFFVVVGVTFLGAAWVLAIA